MVEQDKHPADPISDLEPGSPGCSGYRTSGASTSRFFSGSKFSIQAVSLYSIANAFIGFDGDLINSPLWFLRDLMTLVLLSPLIYYLVSKMGRIVITILNLVWLEIPFIFSGFIAPRALLFFSPGMWLALNEDKIKIKPSHPIYKIAVVIYLITAVVEAYLITQGIELFYLHQFNVAFGCLCLCFYFIGLGSAPGQAEFLPILLPPHFLFMCRIISFSRRSGKSYTWWQIQRQTLHFCRSILALR